MTALTTTVFVIFLIPMFTSLIANTTKEPVPFSSTSSRYDRHCYLTGIAPSHETCPVEYKVITHSRHNCYLYCFYTHSCEVFSYNNKTLSCYLYNIYLNNKYPCDWEPKNDHWISAMKLCFGEKLKCMTISKFETDGGYIKKSYSDGKCLGVVTNRDEPGSVRLTWTSCNSANKWFGVPQGGNRTVITQPRSGLCLSGKGIRIGTLVIGRIVLDNF